MSESHCFPLLSLPVILLVWVCMMRCGCMHLLIGETIPIPKTGVVNLKGVFVTLDTAYSLTLTCTNLLRWIPDFVHNLVITYISLDDILSFLVVRSIKGTVILVYYCYTFFSTVKSW